MCRSSRPNCRATRACRARERGGRALFTHVLAADLNWGERGRRVAVALCHADGRVQMAAGDRSDATIHAMLGQLSPTAAALVLLDVPIEGMEALDGARSRPVDRALASAGIAVLPSALAGQRGPRLRDAILHAERSRLTRIDVREMYPYAIYRVLAYLDARGALGPLGEGESHALLDADFMRFRPPRYKRRERDRDLRWRGIRYLHDLLTHPALDMRWEGLPAPEHTRGLAEDHLVDLYEAALGGVLGMLLLRGSGYVAFAGDIARGEMVLLADVWLRKRLTMRVPIAPIRATRPPAG
jgi:predicted nuclease with RNAse H fold